MKPRPNHPSPFAAPVQKAGFRAVLPRGTGSDKVVDIGISRSLEALSKRTDDVLLGSHYRNLALKTEQLLDSGHDVAMLGLHELMSGVYAELGIHTHGLAQREGLECDQWCPPRWGCPGPPRFPTVEPFAGVVQR